jgi:transposase-like protein
MPEETMVTKYTEQERLNHVKGCEKWRSKGHSIKTYAERHGILPRTLQNWVEKYQTKSLMKPKEIADRTLVKVAATCGWVLIDGYE